MEEERPVHVVPEDGELRLDDAQPGEAGRLEVVGVPLDRRLALARARQREERLALLLAVELPQPLLRGPVLVIQALPPLRLEQVGHDADDPRGVEHVQGRLCVRRRDPDRSVLARGRGSADQERQLEAAPLHLVGHVDHLVERRRDQPGETDDVAVLLLRSVEDPVGRNHHPEVDHLVVVAPEHDTDDVLADVVDVALDGGEHDLAAGASVALGPSRPP